MSTKHVICQNEPIFFKKPHNKAFSKNSDKKTYSNDPKKQFCVILIVIFTFAGFADLPAAKVCQFADCRGKGNYWQNAMYSFGFGKCQLLLL